SAQIRAAPRHRAGRLLDNAGRRVEPDALLSLEMGVARRAREEVERLPGRSGMAPPARRDRSKRPDRAARRELVPGADQLLLGEVDFSQRGDETRRMKNHRRPVGLQPTDLVRGKAGTHLSAARAPEKWIPAFAGTPISSVSRW